MSTADTLSADPDASGFSHTMSVAAGGISAEYPHGSGDVDENCIGDLSPWTELLETVILFSKYASSEGLAAASTV